MLSRAHASTPTLDSQVRNVLTLCDITYSRLTSSASSQLFDRRMLSLFLSDSQGLRLPWFIPPSFLPRALISFNPTNRRTCSWLLARHRHLRVDAASFARHCHHRVSAAFTRWWHCSSPPSPGRCGLSCSFCSSRRPADGIRSDSPALRRTVHVLFVIFLFCLLFVCLFVCLFVPTHGSDARFYTPASRTACSSTSHFTPCCQCRCVACAFSNLGW